MKYIEKLTKKLSKKDIQHMKYILESVIYIIAIIVIIAANIFGNIYIRMIPLLFILGIIGKIIFNRPVTTTVFSIIVSICFVKLSGISSLKENLLLSCSMGCFVFLGELTGFLIQIIYKDIVNKKKKIKGNNKKIIISYILVPVILVAILYTHNYLNSNIFTYLKYKNQLLSYMDSQYKNEKFKILNARYNFVGDKNFKFIVEDLQSERVYNFVVYIDNKLDIQDGILLSNLSSKEKIYDDKLKEFMVKNNLIEKYKNVDTGDYELSIQKNVNVITDEEKMEFAKNVSNFLNDTKEFSLKSITDQVFISLISEDKNQEDLFSYIYLERYDDKVIDDYEYIYNSLNIEYID